MKRDHYHLAIWLSVFVLLSVVALIGFTPGFWQYQQIRWRTKITPEQIEAGMTGMLATTKATEELLGRRDLTSADFQMVSADLLREMQKMAEYNDLAMILRVGYLNKLREDPTGADLKIRLYEEITSDVAQRIDDESSLGESLRYAAYEYAVSDPKFEDLLLRKIGSLERLRIPVEAAEEIKAEQAGTGQPATRPESKSEGGDKPQPEAEGRSR
jgi:hypothetical protein